MRICRRLRAVAARHRWAAVLAVTAFLIRALVPAGYMPGSLADGSFITVCPGGLPAGFLQPAGHPHHEHHRSGGDGSTNPGAATNCPLGALFSSAVAWGETPSLAAVPIAQPSDGWVPGVRHGRICVVCYLSRAPPDLV